MFIMYLIIILLICFNNFVRALCAVCSMVLMRVAWRNMPFYGSFQHKTRNNQA